MENKYKDLDVCGRGAELGLDLVLRLDNLLELRGDHGAAVRDKLLARGLSWRHARDGGEREQQGAQLHRDLAAVPEIVQTQQGRKVQLVASGDDVEAHFHVREQLWLEVAHCSYVDNFICLDREMAYGQHSHRGYFGRCCRLRRCRSSPAPAASCRQTG